jgi:hypothetical protein
MSKGHQSSRRRSYGRRQHELHELNERTDQNVGVLGWIDESEMPGPGAQAAGLFRQPSWSGSGWPVEPMARAALGEWLNLKGID